MYSLFLHCSRAAVVAAMVAHTVAIAAKLQCMEPRTVSPVVAAIAELNIGRNIADQGHTLYGGLVGVPPPKDSVIALKRAWTKFALPNEEWRDMAIRFFTLQNDEFPSTDREVLNLPFEVYWCLAAKGDMVLLSDLSNDHYTRIASIDRAHETVDLIDRWPNILLEFNGVAPVSFVAPAGSGFLTGGEIGSIFAQ